MFFLIALWNFLRNHFFDVSCTFDRRSLSKNNLRKADPYTENISTNENFFTPSWKICKNLILNWAGSQIIYFPKCCCHWSIHMSHALMNLKGDSSIYAFPLLHHMIQGKFFALSHQELTCVVLRRVLETTASVYTTDIQRYFITML